MGKRKGNFRNSKTRIELSIGVRSLPFHQIEGNALIVIYRQGPKEHSTRRKREGEAIQVLR